MSLHVVNVRYDEYLTGEDAGQARDWGSSAGGCVPRCKPTHQTPLPRLRSPAGALPRGRSQLSYGGVRSTGLHLPSSGLLVGFLLPHPGGLPGLQELPHHVSEPHADLHSGAAFSNTTRRPAPAP